MERMILHSDINACYANIELLHHPELRGKPVAVGGDEELRHGIVLAKDELARRTGVRTGMTLWEARRLCPELTVLKPNFQRYLDYSRQVRRIYAEFTDRCEPFGIDECWLDVTGCIAHGDGAHAAEEIRRRVLCETGLTVSVGVSWCKVIAKLGSDYKKPNAVTVIDRTHFREMVWPLPVRDLLFVGRSTARQLDRLGIHTIGELATTDMDVLIQRLGKNGGVLHAYANGIDPSVVRRAGELPPPKSIGNSATAPRDLVCEEDVRAALLSLTESVAARLRAEKLLCGTVELSLRGVDLHWHSHRAPLQRPTDMTSELLKAALTLCREAHVWPEPLRSIGVRALDLTPIDAPRQMDLFEDAGAREKQRNLDLALDHLRAKYGKECVLRGRAHFDPALGQMAMDEHSFLRK